MPNYESGKKNCANQAVFLGPSSVASGWPPAPQCRICRWFGAVARGQTVVLRAAAHWTSHCIRLWLDKQQTSQLIRGCCTLSGTWHSRWDNLRLVWNCLCKKSKSGISIVMVMDELRNDHAKTCKYRCWFLNELDQEHFLYQCNSLDHILQLSVVEKIHYPTWSGQVFALCRNQSEFIKFTTACWMNGFDISLTVLWKFDLCTSNETGPS